MKYTASLDKLAKIVTVAITALFAFVMISQFFLLKVAGDYPLMILIGFPLLYILVYVFRPINYSITHDSIVINRPAKNVILNKADIKSVELIDKNLIRYTMRLAGVGGLFGYFGKFVNRKLGKMTWYATRRDKTVLITTSANKKIIITPDEPENFVTEFAKK